MNKQREAVYGLRHQLMEGVDQKQLITDDYLSTLLSNILDQFAPEKAHADEWKTDELFNAIYEQFGARLESEIDPRALDRHDLGETIFNQLGKRYAVKEQLLGSAGMRYHERIIMLSVLDGLWKDHLLQMDHLKEGIGLRGYAQQDPLVAYKKESFEIFEAMMLRFQEDTVRHLFRMQIIGPDGQPIETESQLEQAQLAGLQHQPIPDPQSPALPDVIPVREQPSMPVTPPNAPARVSEMPRLEQQAAPRVSKAPSTTIDALERGVRTQETARTGTGAPGRGVQRFVERQRQRPSTGRRRKGRSQRPLPLWLRQEVQTMPRSGTPRR